MTTLATQARQAAGASAPASNSRSGAPITETGTRRFEPSTRDAYLEWLIRLALAIMETDPATPRRRRAAGLTRSTTRFPFAEWVASLGEDPAVAEWVASVGEDPAIAERIVVAPTVGRFRSLPRARQQIGRMICEGHLLGFVDQPSAMTPVRSPFAGQLMGMLALPGEPVWAGHPIAWLRP